MDKILFVSVDGSAPKIDDHIFGAADLFKGVKVSKMPLALKKINEKDVVRHPAVVYEKIQSGIEARMKQLSEE